MFFLKKEEVATDPVCLMKVNVKKAKFSQVYKDKTYSERNLERGREDRGRKIAGIYYFCSENCHEQFRQNPEEYLSK